MPMHTPPSGPCMGISCHEFIKSRIQKGRQKQASLLRLGYVLR